MSKVKKEKRKGPKPGDPIFLVCANPDCRDTFEIPSRYKSRAKNRIFCSQECSNKSNSRVKKTPWDRLDEKSEIKKNGCRIWLGNINSSGDNPVGLIRVDGKRIPVHRFVYEVTNDCEIPKNQIIVQMCGNPLCCSPFHLMPTTRSAHLKQRQNKGVAHWRHKLKATNVRSIRKRYEKKPTSETIKKLASKYNVSLSTIYSIIHRRTWKHI